MFSTPLSCSPFNTKSWSRQKPNLDSLLAPIEWVDGDRFVFMSTVLIWQNSLHSIFPPSLWWCKKNKSGRSDDTRAGGVNSDKNNHEVFDCRWMKTSPPPVSWGWVLDFRWGKADAEVKVCFFLRFLSIDSDQAGAPANATGSRTWPHYFPRWCL